MSQTQVRQCVYCLVPKVYAIGKAKTLSEFNSEHLMHRSMASGYSKAPTLIGRVCKDCNQNFGDTIDSVFARSGYEGLQRFKHGLKSIDSVHELSAGGLGYASPAPGVDGYVPVEVEHYENRGKLAARIEPYIMVYSRKHNQELQISLAEISNIQWLIDVHDLDVRRIRTATNGTQKDNDEIADRLKQHGVDILDSLGPAIAVPFRVNSYAPSKDTLRAVAKIAFNYFTHLCEKVDPATPLSPDFNGLRDSVYKGTPYHGVQLIGHSLVDGNSRDHFCVLRLAEKNGKTIPVVIVSLFNGFTYAFSLGETSLPSSLLPAEQGHRWDVTKKTFGRIPLNVPWSTNF